MLNIIRLHVCYIMYVCITTVFTEEKVSFAKMPDVSVRECRRLLKLYTPENARVNKMYQMIFVKCVSYTNEQYVLICKTASKKYNRVSWILGILGCRNLCHCNNIVLVDIF